MKKLKWSLVVIGILLIFAGAYFAGRMVNHGTVKSSRATQISSTSSSKTNSASSSSSSIQNKTNEKLDYNTITPMQTAAAIAYYGENQVHSNIWDEIFSGSNDLDIYQQSNADHLNVKGRGNSWMLHPSNEGGGHMATYTVGANGDVAFYDVSAVNKNKNQDLIETENLRDIISYINDHDAVSQVKDKAQHIHLQQADSDD